MKTALLVLLVACSNGGSKPAPAVEPAKTAPKAVATTGLALGEATVIELLDKRFQPVSNPRWKLHADGTTERGNDSTGEWRRDLTVATDGTLSFEGKPVAKIGERSLDYTAGNSPPIAIDGNTVSVVVWTKEHDGEDLTAKVELATDGKVTVHHRDGTRVYWKIEAADPAVMRTAFLVFATTMKARLD